MDTTTTKGQPTMDTTLMTLDWSDRRADTPEEATAKMRWWAMRHGLKQAVCNVTIRERALIDKIDMRQIYADAANIEVLSPTDTDKRNIMRRWCESNIYKVITSRELSEIGGCSPAMARRFIADNPHHFKRINQYTHEVRDAKSDRAHDKSLQ